MLISIATVGVGEFIMEQGPRYDLRLKMDSEQVSLSIWHLSVSSQLGAGHDRAGAEWAEGPVLSPRFGLLAAGRPWGARSR